MKFSESLVNLTDGLRWLSFSPLCAHPWVLHGFLVANRNSPRGSKPETLTASLCRIASQKRRLILLSQTHRDECVIAACGDRLEGRYQGDAILTDRDDVLISVQVADCLPIFLVNESSGVIGLVHAGWRGTILGVARETLRKAGVDLGCRAADFTAVLGPCIRSCCYQISDDVAVLFDRECVKRTNDGRAILDLIRANVKQLTDCGVKQNRVFVTGECTCCNAELFFSHRREGKAAGRMVGFMALRRTGRPARDSNLRKREGK